ncbi:unnamed protein product [Clavelina lepadiformis]|uniref:Phospholipase A2 n=1 Tax=Clavelina lepadiformis TaxID=159417 RepID=A0ABP0GZG4_CLALP
MEEFIKHEDEIQSIYDNIKLDFKPNTIIKVTLLRCRNISLSSFYDTFDTPDPKFKVSCSKSKYSGKLESRTIPDNCEKCDINESFQFVLRDDVTQDEPISIEIEIWDRDFIKDDLIAKNTVDVSKSSMPMNAACFRTIKFQSTSWFFFSRQHGELDVLITKSVKNAPDLRFSLGLDPREKEYRKKRIPRVYESMRTLLGATECPKSISETPIVSVACSGGGLRATTGMCGAMEALKDAGLLDVITYLCGLSGSAWYLQTAYTRGGVATEEQEKFHEYLKDAVAHNFFWDFVNPSVIHEFTNLIQESKDKYDQPATFADYAPGFILGRTLLGQENMSKKPSDLEDYVADGRVPMPIFTALHAKGVVPISSYHAHVEITPFEFAIPEYGIGIDAKFAGSSWTNGYLARHRPEGSIHFYIGMVGCAYSVLLATFLRQGTERNSKYLKYIEQERLDGKKLRHQERLIEVESDESDTDLEDEDIIDPGVYKDALSPTMTSNLDTEISPPNFFLKKVLNTSFFTDRNAYIGRASRMYNVVQSFDSLKRFRLNPLDSEPTVAEAREVIEKLGMQNMKMNPSKKKDILSFIDAGIQKNVPTDTTLRPQRTTDLLIVFDFNGYDSDENFNYSPLLSGALHAWRSGIKFPQVDFEKIKNSTPEEFLVFPGDDNGSPTILWFTLCNKKFKDLNDYVPRSKEPAPENSEGKKFNDFPVHSEGSNYSTFNLNYNRYNFDQLRELMYYNVSSHVNEIRSELVNAVKRKQRRVDDWRCANS